MEIEGLVSNHEEANTMVVVRTKAAAEKGAEHIVVDTPDTDVLVLLLHHHTTVGSREIFILTGREGKHAHLVRYIPIHKIYEKLEKKQHDIMLPVYCLIC